MTEEIVVQGRRLSPADLAWVRELIGSNPDWNRTRLSREICRCWEWKDEVGRYKDMACRTMLLKLERRELLQLPPRRSPSVNHLRGRNFEPVLHQSEPIRTSLRDLRPISFSVAEQGWDRALWQTLLHLYHYLSFATRVGKSLSYLAYDRHQRPVAALLFGAAAWKAQGRDRFIGWSAPQRQNNLHLIANNMRFLIPPWVEVPHLASHVLGMAGRQVCADWTIKYGHGLELLETFVEQTRFAGTCYRAANWLNVGQTTGRTRNDVDHSISRPIKTVMVYPLRPDFRRQLTKEG